MPDLFKGNTYYLVRHGEAENNVRNLLNATSRGKYPLTTIGRAQANAVAEYLEASPIDFLVCSSIQRTYETARIIQEKLQVPLSVDGRLTEARFGTFEDKDVISFFEFMKTHGGRTIGDPEQGIEGYMDIRLRVRSFLEDICETFTGKHIAIVSHLDTLQELYAELMNEPVGAEQGDRGWYPAKGSCLVVSATRPTESFSPQSK